MFAYDADLQTNILKVLAAGTAPMSPRAIEKALPVGGRPPLRGLKSLLEDMVRDGRLAREAGGGELYCTADDGPASVGVELERLIARLAARGLPLGHIRTEMLRHLGAAGPAAPPVAQPASRSAATGAILEAMHRLEPRVNEGAAVSIARLRDALSAQCDKPAFDHALRALLARGVVELQSHAWPARLTAEEKSMLLENGRGGWFDSAALLRRPA